MSNVIEMTIDQAIESKAAFIQFIHHIEMSKYAGWVEESFTDEMAHNFIEFYNGSYDDQEIVLPSGEVLPSLVDDIQQCMNAHNSKSVKNASFTFNLQPFNNALQVGLSLN